LFFVLRNNVALVSSNKGLHSEFKEMKWSKMKFLVTKFLWHVRLESWGINRICCMLISYTFHEKSFQFFWNSGWRMSGSMIFHTFCPSKNFAANVARMKSIQRILVFIFMYSLMYKKVVLFRKRSLAKSALICFWVCCSDSTFSSNKASRLGINWVYRKHFEWFRISKFPGIYNAAR